MGLAKWLFVALVYGGELFGPFNLATNLKNVGMINPIVHSGMQISYNPLNLPEHIGPFNPDLRVNLHQRLGNVSESWGWFHISSPHHQGKFLLLSGCYASCFIWDAVPLISSPKSIKNCDIDYINFADYSSRYCRRLPDIFDGQIEVKPVVDDAEGTANAGEIGSSLLSSNLSGFHDSIPSRLSSGLGLVDHSFGGFGGDLGVVQSAPDQQQTNEGDSHTGSRGYQHPHGPPSHVLLGLQVAYFTFAGSLTLFLVLLGYQQAYRGIDALERRRYVYGYWACVSGGLLALGSTFFLPAGGYWLIFNSDLFALSINGQ